ncbi:MAG TPA: CmcI family methyltransferase [Steroidobacter sp.]|uniref:CmcI family methyltransferase n=1 Tax=Steroidobacter sp. TaxID=1978227 RepID=UPI002ED976B1
MDDIAADTKMKHIVAEEYVTALQQHYPDLAWTQTATRLLEAHPFDYGAEGRYEKPTQRANDGITGWITHSFGPQGYNISRVYKGLLCGKSPIDLWLYAACLWELKPRTVIELGSLQGGSALWLADQATAMGLDCEVHSFDLLSKAVSPRARHPSLHFHQVDLKRLESLQVGLLKELPHPWLVIDDAHVNVLNVLSVLRQFMQAGDYFVKEDSDGLGTTTQNAEYLSLAESLGFYVDRIYADGFGFNVTTARNTWFTLLPGCDVHVHDPKALSDMTWEELT